MTMPSDYCEETLYPMQDGVMSILAKCNSNFYLTGGTALSRGYYNHRYSDDLDFFVNNDTGYVDQVGEILGKLKEGGYIWNADEHYVKSENFTRVRVRTEKYDAYLKLDFVNDLAPHFGNIVETPIYSKTDPIRNILSNKLSAIFRFEAKDIADIREIALREHVDWSQAIKEAREKDAGADLVYVSQIMTGIPQDRFSSIQWVSGVEWEVFKNDVDKIALDMLLVDGVV